MRLLGLLPDMVMNERVLNCINLLWYKPSVARLADALLGRFLIHRGLYVSVAHGGTLNIMRHLSIAQSLGVDARIACPSGRDTYGIFNVVDLPYMRWSDRRDDDVVLIPDFCSELADKVRGPVIVYQQSPIQVRNNFDYLDDRVTLWTDSPFMLELCRQTFPGKDIPIVPNVVDDKMFPFVPQCEREPGLILAFPRKGPEYIDATRRHYEMLGGKYWKFELIDGIPLRDLARRMGSAQAFLASATSEGCALPPQESMACGMIVVGKSALGANFSMVHRETAMIAETPEDAARSLIEIEDPDLRNALSRNGHAFISRYFPDAEPKQLWQSTLRQLGFALRSGVPSQPIGRE